MKPFKEKKTLEKAENKFATFAMNKRLQPHGAGASWKLHSLVIHSSRIQTSLGKVFEGYRVTYETDRELILEPPFTPFVHCWAKLLQAEQDEPDTETKKHIHLLRTTLSPHLADSLRRCQLVEETGIAEFQDLLFTLAPGDILVKKTDVGMEAGILREIDLVSRPTGVYLSLDIDIVDWNGINFGFRTNSWKIPQYRGTRRLFSLDIFPLRMHPDRAIIRESLVRRGRKLESLCGKHFKSYSGPVEMLYGSSLWGSADKRVSFAQMLGKVS